MRNNGAFIAIGGPMRCDDWPIQSDYLRAMLGRATGGKSTAGADIAICAAPRGVLLQHSRNSRDGIGVVRLEGGHEFSALTYSGGIEFHRLMGEMPAIETFVLEECHFCDTRTSAEALIASMICAREDGKIVVGVGIDTDHLGNEFDWWSLAKQHADSWITLSGRCWCGAPSEQTGRHTMSEARTEAGPIGDYEPMCRGCRELLEEYKMKRRARRRRPASTKNSEAGVR